MLPRFCGNVRKSVAWTMLQAELTRLLASEDEGARARIATRVGERLTLGELSEAERRGAEELARALAQDAIERVRRGLSMALRHARHLPRDIALKIAHDVDSVACPFLEVTEVFSDSDWQQIVMTISRGALIAVARRSSMSPALALAVAETADTVAAETLIGNPATPMTAPLCRTLIDRFHSEPWIFDKLAMREDLIADIAVELTAKVSAAARKKLERTYGVAHLTGPVVTDAEIAAILSIIRRTSPALLPSLVGSLRRDNRLRNPLLLAALREGQTGFVAAALSDSTGMQRRATLNTLERGTTGAVIDLLRQADIPPALYDEFRDVLAAARAVRKDRPGTRLRS